MMTKTEIDKLARQIYEEYIFGGTGRPTYGVDFDKKHILQALEMMVHKTNEHWLAKNISSKPLLSDSLGEYERGYKDGCNDTAKDAADDIAENYSPNV